MPADEPLVRLPDEISLTLGEVEDVLLALDLAHAETSGAERTTIDRAVRLITRKLWPDLGDILDEE